MHLERQSEGLHVQLDAQEAGIVRELLKEMRILLEADVPAEDRVIQRIFPRALEDDEEEAAYREMVGEELRRIKLESLGAVEDQLGPLEETDVILDTESVERWLRVLNDIRLAIGTRLEVDEEKMERPFDPTDPEAPALSVLHWLGWLQGSMLEEMNQPLNEPTKE